MTLVSGSILRMRIFMGGSSEWERQMTVRLSTAAIFGSLGGYFFGNVRERQRRQYYIAIW